MQELKNYLWCKKMQRHACVVIVQCRLGCADKDTFFYLEHVGILFTSNYREVIPCRSGYAGARSDVLHRCENLEAT